MDWENWKPIIEHSSCAVILDVCMSQNGMLRMAHGSLNHFTSIQFTNTYILFILFNTGQGRPINSRVAFMFITAVRLVWIIVAHDYSYVYKSRTISAWT